MERTIVQTMIMFITMSIEGDKDHLLLQTPLFAKFQREETADLKKFQNKALKESCICTIILFDEIPACASDDNVTIDTCNTF